MKQIKLASFCDFEVNMIRVGILGYGNLGRGVEYAIAQATDMELVAVFTRRAPETLKIVTPDVSVVSINDVALWKDKIDVMILCGGSATDLPLQTPEMAKLFHVVDSFDTHAKIPEHFANVDAVAKEASKVAMISVGWDPGLFSLNRLYASAILPEGKDYTFWGKGVSQGHSDAVRRIPGVKNAKQYTIPVDEALEKVRSGINPELSTREKHRRECFVVDVEFAKNHSGMAHGGKVIRAGKTGENGKNTHVIEYSIKLDSNPEFTASVLVAYARAAVRLSQEGIFGCKTVFDIPPAYLSTKSGVELRKELL